MELPRRSSVTATVIAAPVLSEKSEPNALAWGESANDSRKPHPRRAPSAQGNTDGSASSLPDSARPRLLRTIKAHIDGGSQSLSFSADGSKLASYAKGVSKLWDVMRVKGRYEVANFGEDLWSGRTGLSLEKTEQGTIVKSINSQHHDVVSGEIHVGDRIIGISDDLRGDMTDLIQNETSSLPKLLSGPHNSIVRLTVEDTRTENASHDRRKVELRRSYKLDPRPMRVCFSPDGRTVAIAGQKHGTTSINLATGRTTRYPQMRCTSVAISVDGLLAMDGRTDVLVWNLRKDQEYARLGSRVSADPSLNGAGTLAFSPDGKFLAMGTGYRHMPQLKQSHLKVWRVSDLKEVGGEPIHKNDRVLADLTFTHDGAHLIVADHAGKIRVWDTNTWQLLDRQFVSGDQSRVVAISADGKTLATGARRQIILWDFATGKKRRVLSGPTPWELDFSPDGKTLVSGHSNHNVILWDVAKGMQLRTFHAHSDAVMGAAFSPDGDTLATVGTEGELRFWEAAPFAEIESYPPTLEGMFRLGELRIRQERHEEAEAILRRLLSLQERTLSGQAEEITNTRELLDKAIEGQRKLTHQPT